MTIIGITAPKNGLGVQGGTVTSDATYYYRTFTANETLSVTGRTLTVDYIIVGGGGGAGIDSTTLSGGFATGGGAGGGVIYGSSLNLLGNYPIVIGAGGAANATKGDNSSAFSLTAVGGGCGASASTFPPPLSGAFVPYSGGSGGGGNGSGPGGGTYWSNPIPASNGAAGTSGQGNAGGNGTSKGAGGGGGAVSAGGNGTASQSGNGGNGYQWVNSTYYGGGGGGSASSVNGVSAGTGGLGGGGNGTSGLPSDGDMNVGGGAGGGSGNLLSAGYGGDGVVIIRYTRASVGG